MIDEPKNINDLPIPANWLATTPSAPKHSGALSSPEQRTGLRTLTSPIPADDLTTATELIAPPHPGEVLNTEFLEPLGISQYRLARDLYTTDSQVSKLMRGAIGLSAEMAYRLATYFGNSPEFWLGIQQEYDLWNVSQTVDITHITPWNPSQADGSAG